jgi:2-amino-4-hydroxy-6-hydroxymethyldihydropteridine diphosphokinase
MTGSGHEVCLLLGSNIQPEKNLPLAVSFLRQYLQFRRVSSVWETAAVGAGGPNFLNAALLATTSLDAQALKEQVLRPLETQLGRVRTADKFAPRPIDLDIILWDGLMMEPDLWALVHLAVPIAEILPGYRSVSLDETLEEAADRLAQANPVKLRPDVRLPTSPDSLTA